MKREPRLTHGRLASTGSVGGLSLPAWSKAVDRVAVGDARLGRGVEPRRVVRLDVRDLLRRTAGSRAVDPVAGEVRLGRRAPQDLESALPRQDGEPARRRGSGYVPHLDAGLVRGRALDERLRGGHRPDDVACGHALRHDRVAEAPPRRAAPRRAELRRPRCPDAGTRRSRGAGAPPRGSPYRRRSRPLPSPWKGRASAVRRQVERARRAAPAGRRRAAALESRDSADGPRRPESWAVSARRPAGRPPSAAPRATRARRRLPRARRRARSAPRAAAGPRARGSASAAPSPRHRRPRAAARTVVPGAGSGSVATTRPPGIAGTEWRRPAFSRSCCPSACRNSTVRVVYATPSTEAAGAVARTSRASPRWARRKACGAGGVRRRGGQRVSAVAAGGHERSEGDEEEGRGLSHHRMNRERSWSLTSGSRRRRT